MTANTYHTGIITLGLFVQLSPSFSWAMILIPHAPEKVRTGGDRFINISFDIYNVVFFTASCLQRVSANENHTNNAAAY